MNTNDNQFQSANPILPVKDVKATSKFYKEYLGFKVDILWENPNYACVSRGGVTIEFGEGRPAHVGNGVCYIHVNDARVVHQEFVSRGLDNIGRVADRDYGSKDFRVKDNDGNILIFGSALANKDELIAKKNLA